MENHVGAAVAVRSVFAGYGPRVVLHGVAAEIPRHRATALMGPNGSGKSTLLSLLAGVIRPASGVIDHSRTRRPALVVQRSAVPDAFPVTVRETVAMGRWAHRGPWRRLTRRDRSVVEACLERMDIADLASRRLGSLSGGQRQRALLAQGLAQESDLLLLDEPTAGLDAASRRHILEVLDDAQAEGVTVVHATHDRDAALRAAHCLVLAEGRLIAEGPPATVLAREPVERAHASES